MVVALFFHLCRKMKKNNNLPGYDILFDHIFFIPEVRMNLSKKNVHKKLF